MATKEGPSLEEILGDTPQRKLVLPCQDEHLCEIARHLTDWPALAPLMGITAPEMEEIRGKWPFSVGGQRMEFMRKWKEKHGRKGTYQKLCKGFWKAGEVTVAEKVCEVLCSQESSSESSSGEAEHSPDDPLFPDPKPQKSSLASCSSTSAPSDPLEPFANELRITYGSQTPNFIVVQWPPPPTHKVFNLALIQSEEIVRRRPLDENLVRLTLTGNIDDVMKIKGSIKLEDLFQGWGKKRKVVLIEGAPGSGKSTLAYDICQKWEARDLFHDQFKIVIYVQFRDLEMQSAQEIADLFPMELESDRRAATSLLKDCRGEGVLFVLDGWDEYTPGLQQGSLFEKLICRPEMLRLQRSTVVITSRPIASGNLQKYATSRIEIVGFNPEEVCRYFEDVFKDALTVQKLYDHLQERPLIKASCYLPLNVAIVAHLFMELNHTLPITLHGLFSSLVLSCIIRHLTKESGTEPDVTSLDGLPSDVQEIFQKVCVTAYEGSMRNKVIFSSQDLHSYGLPKNVNTLSLMQVVQSFATGKPKSYHFLHLSIQELLAARHISSLPPPEQVRIFNELFGQPRFDAIFRYYTAFTKLQTEGIRDFVAYVAQSAVSRGTEEKINVELLNLMHCLYEAHDVFLCHFVSSQLKGTLDVRYLSLSPFDLLSLKYFLSCVNDSCRTEDSNTDSCGVTVSELNLHDCNLTPEDIDSLSLHRVVELNLSVNKVTCACVASVLNNNPQLKVIQLGACRSLTDEGVQLLAAALRDHRSLEVLDLRFCSGFTQGMQHILQAIHNHHSVRGLDIGYCNANVKDIAAVLEENESLQVLRIRGEVITDGTPVHVVLSQALKKNRTLERLQMKLPFRGWEEEFVGSLRDCHLKTLGLDEDIDRYTERVLSQQREKVNKVRRDQGLPPFQIEYS